MKVVSAACSLLLLKCTSVVFAQSPADVAPWDDLKSSLASPNSLQAGSIAAWQNECVPPFAAEGFPVPQPLENGSNYQLFQQPSGQCMNLLSCAYKQCEWPLEPVDAYDPNEASQMTELFDLPAQVLHPDNVGDIALAVKFCAKHRVPITVKTTGHSYVGASTREGTLLINMSKYPKYSIDDSADPPLSLITECGDSISSENRSDVAMACELAKARRKDAVLRVGGGEIWDEALRSVWYWNLLDSNVNKYHVVTGAAGTVSAAGGWLTSGGLSGTNGMRMFGIGVDQVVHMEMVLPSGTHVRFGPSLWVNEEGFVYPKTIHVTGYCNNKPAEANEANWEWVECEENINFHDLWFAARGGGGGTFGVVTSLYYQLHERPGTLKVGSLIIQSDWSDFFTSRLDVILKIHAMHLDFHIDFFFNPQALNVTEKDSNYLGSPVFSTSPFFFNTFFGFDGATDVWVSAWNQYFNDHKDELLQLGLEEERVLEIASWAVAGEEQAAYGIPSLVEVGGVPAGRITDSPRPYVLPDSAQFANFWHIPRDLLVNKRDQLIPILAQFADGKSGYVLGGRVSDAHDQSASVPASRREAGLLLAVPDEFLGDVLEVLHGDQGFDGGYTYPGVACHNHFSLDSIGPLKSDWTTPCPSALTTEEKVDQCISQQENVYGTELLSALEAIKAAVDPYSIFVCAGGIGYNAAVTAAEQPTSSSAFVNESTLTMLFIITTLVLGGW